MHMIKVTRHCAHLTAVCLICGTAWILTACVQGLDISEDMLEVAKDREVEGDLCLHDLGHGLPLRPGSFDGAVSISAVQWLCNAVCADQLLPV